MTTELKTKVTIINRDDRVAVPDKTASTKAKSAIISGMDKYEKESQGAYRALVTGKIKGSSGAAATREDAIAGILDSLTLPDQSVEHTLPYVPNFQEEILIVTGGENLAPVVERYSALQKVIESQIYEAKKLLQPENMSELPASLMMDLQCHLQELRNTLADCNQQLEIAKKYHQAEIDEAKAEMEADS